MILETQNLCKSTILKDINISVRVGECVALIGPSGAGKSSLLHILGLLDHPTEGDVRLKDRSTNKLSNRERTYLRRHELGFVYQFHHLLPNFNAIENVSMPLLLQGYSKKEAFRKSQELLENVDLGHRLQHKIHQLSGGEQQRMAIARGIIHGPSILLADEPTGNLDTQNTQKVFELLMTLVKERSMSALVATHNIELAKKMDRIISIKDGIIIN